MSEPLDEGEFGAFFEAVHGYRPYAWQARLLREVAASGNWPTVIAAPTGAGKTAVLDIALFHLALSAGDKPRPAPLRIVLAVDRRIIVDQAFERAKKLRDALESPEPPDIVRRVADRLAALSGARPLHVAQLRGGMPLERDWAKRPDQPAILCTTVDQLGSRLLFRGYGVSTSMAPIHAGLLGNDTRVILDEAHLSHAFTDTLEAISVKRKADDAPELPWGWSALTATPRKDGDAFKLRPEERGESRIKRRLAAKKPVEIVKSKNGEPGDFAKKLAKRAETMAGELCLREIGAPTVAIVVNRVALARMVFEDLRGKRHREGDPDAPEQVILLTGRVRPVERDRLIERHRDRLEGRREGASAPLFVVATQCIEAGADFDFDGIVSQIAPLDALRQRFGRLARSGNRGDTAAPGVVTAMKDEVGARPDPVYGKALHHSWAWLKKNAEGDRKKKGVDFGPDALDALLERVPPCSECFAPAPPAPLLRNADLEAFSMTSPRPFPDPDPALFLHGEFRTDNDVSLVWRADIPKDDPDPKVIAEVLTLVPPRTGEALRLPLWVARRWLSARLAEKPTRDDPDHSLVDVPMRKREAGGAESDDKIHVYRFYRWRGVKESRMVTFDELRPGDVIVLPAERGGCDRFGWSPASDAPVDDIADAAASAYAGRKAALRLHPKTMPDRWEEIVPLLESESGPTEVLMALPEEVLPEIDGWREANGRPRLLRPYPDENAAILVVTRGLGDGPSEESAEPATENDDLGSSGAEALSLCGHSRAVGKKAGEFACRLQFAPTLAATLKRAAEWHDMGKDDPRFQAFLRDCGGLDASEGPYAKSGAPNVPAGARNRAGLPDRWRHEVASVRYAAARLEAAPSGEDDEALLLWLVGTHHGHGRPFFAHDDDWDEHEMTLLDQHIPAAPGPDKLDFDWRGNDWCQLRTQLQKRYGYWGLAHLEACLRLADHRASEEGGG